MVNPFISICIPTYHRPELLTKLLDSIITQTFTDYEIIITDNSENDSIYQVVKKFQGRLAIQYIKNEPGVSATQNSNKVIRLANGLWIKLMHDDDWFSSDQALLQFANAAKASGRDFIFCASNQVNLQNQHAELEQLTGEKLKMINDSYYSLFYLNLIGHPSVVMHKKDDALLYDEQFKWVQDIDFYLRFYKKHGSFEYISEPLVNIGKGNTQESNKYYKNPLVELPEYFRLLAKYPANLSLKSHYVFHLVWNMIKRYKIRNIDHIRSLGYAGVIPEGTDAIIDYQKKVPRFILKQTPSSRALMMRCFRKITRNA